MTYLGFSSAQANQLVGLPPLSEETRELLAAQMKDILEEYAAKAPEDCSIFWITELLEITVPIE